MKSRQEEENFPKKRVLLVDNSTSISSLQAGFSLAGAEVTHAFTNLEALEHLKDEQFSHLVITTQRPDLDELDELLKTDKNSCKIVILSYLNLEAQTSALRKKGFDIRFVHKNQLESNQLQPQNLLD